MRLKYLIDKIKAQLTPHYGEGETKWMVRIIFEHLKGWSAVDLVLKADYEVSDFIVDKVNDIIERLLKDEPIQYIFGDTYWYGMTLKVSRDVLIPREETEELVDIIVKENSSTDLNVMDLCTGSGCIAIALAKNLNFANISAVDVSEKALDIATVNAKINKAAVEFSQADVLNLLPDDDKFDIIVSNPPYIMNKEKCEMDANVLNYEPHIALFVSDDDPLKFYKPISKYALESLNDSGRLYLEINPLTADILKTVLEKDGWKDVELYRDIHKKNRFVRATK